MTMKVMTLLQAVIATIAEVCAAVTTCAMIARGDSLVGILGLGAVTAVIAVLTWLSYEELRDEANEGLTAGD